MELLGGRQGRGLAAACSVAVVRVSLMRARVEVVAQGTECPLPECHAKSVPDPRAGPNAPERSTAGRKRRSVRQGRIEYLAFQGEPNPFGNNFEFREVRLTPPVQRNVHSVAAGQDVNMYMRNALTRSGAIQLDEHHAGA